MDMKDRELIWGEAIETIFSLPEGKLYREFEEVIKSQIALELMKCNHKDSNFGYEAAYRKGMFDGINRLAFYRDELKKKLRDNNK